MSPLLLAKGLLIGITIAAPVGPAAVLCVKRTLLQGRRAGLASGLGAVIADVFYGALAISGIAATADVLIAHQTGLRLAGGLILLGFGLRTVAKPPAEPHEAPIARDLLGAFATTFLLTITNPFTILGFTAILAGFNLVGDDLGLDAELALVLGVAVGALAWWCGLTLFAGYVRSRLGASGLRWLNHFAGAVIVSFGLAILASLLV